jgi:hypothetical protein
MQLLGEQLAHRGLTGADVDAYMFLAPNGGPLDYSGWYPPCVGASSEAGLGFFTEEPEPKWPGRKIKRPMLGFHDLRRANAAGLLADGVGPARSF